MGAINFTGLASGLDTKAIVDAFLAVERLPINRLEQKKADEQARSSGFSSLSSSLADLVSSFETLQNTTFGQFSVASSDEDVLTASGNLGATPGVYNVVVTNIAKNTTLADVGISDKSNTVGSGTFDFTLGAGTAEEETQTLDTSGQNLTLEEFRDRINQEIDGVTATIVDTGVVGANQYRLTLSSDKTGFDNALTTVNNLAGGVDTLALASTQAADDAAFTVNGVAVTRAENTISNVIDGVTLAVKDLGNSTILIERDDTAIVEDAQELAAKFNAFGAKFKSLSASGGALAGDSTARNLFTSVRSLLSGRVAGTGGNTFELLAQVGFKTERDGTVAFDSKEFTDALDQDFKSVVELFAGSSNSNLSGINLGGAGDNAPGGTYTIDITSLDDGSGNVVGTITAPDTTVYVGTGAGSSLLGPEDSAIDGLRFNATAIGTASVQVNLGLGELFSRLSNDYTKGGGIFDKREESIGTRIRSFDEQIEKVEARVERVRLSLTAKFARAEQAINSLKNIQASFTSLTR